MLQRNTTIQDIVDDIVNKRLFDMFIISIGTVIAVNSDTVRCDVRIKVSSTVNRGSISVLKNVPILYPRGGNNIIMYPITEGDTVMIAFSKESISKAIIDSSSRKEIATKFFSSDNAFILGGFILDSEIGSSIDGIDIKIPDKITMLSEDDIYANVFGCLALKFYDMSSLPSASVTYRGQIMTVEGAAGFRDRVYMCMKSDADAYSWVEIANGGV